MALDTTAQSKSLSGITELTVVAAVRRGLIPAADARSYATRAKVALATLNAFRQSSVEAEPTPAITDVIDRIRVIHAFRLAVINSDTLVGPQVLLTVQFDGGWEPYMRHIWRDLGPFLDLVFCNCEGYLTSHDHSYADYIGWVRRHQATTDFYYEAAPLTVDDLRYLRRSRQPRPDPVPPPATALVQWQQARRPLVALYRLADYYPPTTQPEADGATLQRAAVALLGQLDPHLEALRQQPPDWSPVERAAFQWYASAPRAAVASWPQAGAWRPAQVQGGIVEGWPGISHGCLLLLALDDAAAAVRLIDTLRPVLISAAEQAAGRSAEVLVNCSFTLAGLQRAGVPEATLAQLPQEFREGMAARASVLGDILHNHPTRWRLPARLAPGQPVDGAPVALSAVHVVLACHQRGEPSDRWQDMAAVDGSPLQRAIAGWQEAWAGAGVQVLARQPLQRYRATQAGAPAGSVTGHFGHVDGLSQPTLAWPADPAHGRPAQASAAPAAPTAPTAPWGGDEVLPGDVLLGSRNSLGDPPALSGPLWDDSTFLVLRKLRQDVAAYEALVGSPEARATGLAPDALKARVMGRAPSGANLIDGSTGNAFDYQGDPDGLRCPFQSHVRRAHPRTAVAPGKPTPRIVRRGMSFGPLAAGAAAPAGDGGDAGDQGGAPGTGAAPERGLVFMAYNASIAEQFEVIQGWLAGGNSAASDRSYSGLRDPIVGVLRPGDPRVFELPLPDPANPADPAGAAPTVHRLPMPAQPLTTLEWGLYAFVPSLAALAELRALAAQAAREAAAPADDAARQTRERDAQVALAQKGAYLIERLTKAEALLGTAAVAEQWKQLLEDVGPRQLGYAQWIWAAVRLVHGGVLRTPYGILVGGTSQVQEVFDNAQGRYSVGGYAERMRSSFGPIYLGMDAGPAYERLARPVNAAIAAITRDQACEAAWAAMQETLAELRPPQLRSGGEVEVRDLVDGLLARLCQRWFGLPDGTHVVAGDSRLAEAFAPATGPRPPPSCPGHVHSPSRFFFQPHPGVQTAAAGRQHGQALHAAVLQHLQARAPGQALPALAQACAEVAAGDLALEASTLIGTMMGFLPTVDGCLRSLLYEWVNGRGLWSTQLAWQAAPADVALLPRAEQALLAPLTEALQLRPVPELVWRTATVAHALGPVAVAPGEVVVVGIVSAMHEQLLQRTGALWPVFGGDRTPDRPHPQHACPGQAMAIGVLLGALAALLDHGWQPALSPFSLRPV